MACSAKRAFKLTHIYTLQKVIHQLISITWSILNGFSKFFYWHTLWTICNKTIVKDLTTPKIRRYTTV